jgi:hypothetical protein
MLPQTHDFTVATNIQRNSLVSVFLWQLEYHMKSFSSRSNKMQMDDEAIVSRMHVTATLSKKL